MSTDSCFTGLEVDERKDGNRNDMSINEYGRVYRDQFNDHFAAYGKQQVHLHLLATHPSFRSRGAGKQLCDWGLREAFKKGGWIVTVHATPMGKLLYENLGYKFVGYKTVQVEGEEENFILYALEKVTKKSDAQDLVSNHL